MCDHKNAEEQNIRTHLPHIANEPFGIHVLLLGHRCTSDLCLDQKVKPVTGERQVSKHISRFRIWKKINKMSTKIYFIVFRLINSLTIHFFYSFLQKIIQYFIMYFLKAQQVVKYYTNLFSKSFLKIFWDFYCFNFINLSTVFLNNFLAKIILFFILPLKKKKKSFIISETSYKILYQYFAKI